MNYLIIWFGIGIVFAVFYIILALYVRKEFTVGDLKYVIFCLFLAPVIIPFVILEVIKSYKDKTIIKLRK